MCLTNVFYVKDKKGIFGYVRDLETYCDNIACIALNYEINRKDIEISILNYFEAINEGYSNNELELITYKEEWIIQ